MKRISALLLALALVCVCAVPAMAESVYPLTTDTTLRVWFADIAYSSNYTEASEAPLFQQMVAQTGVNVEWVEPAAGADASTAYNLMMAGADLPDIIWSADIVTNATTYLDDGVIIDLNDWITEEYAPNVYALYEANPTFANTYKTDDGRTFGFPCIGEAECWYGPWVRTDWLSECGLETPKTIDDWTTMLKAFKEKYGVALTTFDGNTRSVFLGAFGVPTLESNNGFFQQDGNVVYGPAQDGYKQYLELLASWYADGLIDADYVTNDSTIASTKAAIGEAGAVTGFQVFGAWIKAAQETNGTTGDWASVGYPSLTTDDRSLVEMGLDTLSMATAITTNCEDVETAVRFLDFLYSDAGLTLMNFGIEGTSFAYDENGDPQYTDEFMNGADGMVENARRYTAIVGNCPSMKTFAASVSRNDDASNEAEATWKADWTNADWASYLLPVLGPTEEENETTTDIISALSTNVKEATYAFITGERSLDDWDAYLAELDTIGLSEVLEIRQAQLDRVNAR